MRIHLGHHFYGAGNLGDDFMLAGFLAAMRELAPEATFTGSVPFPLARLQARFPEVEWRPYDPVVRADCIRGCDAWLGLGGAPFQSAQSRWFIDHLIEEAALCRASRKSMFYLSIGIQNEAELAAAEVRQVINQARAIWTRDARSAERLAPAASGAVRAATDIAHLFFREVRPPPKEPGRLTLVPNFDYRTWTGLSQFLEAASDSLFSERVWLAQEVRPLPGSERALYASLPPADQQRWRLVIPDGAPAPESENRTTTPARERSCPLEEALRRWPSGEWLATARYHAALAGAWSESKVIVIQTNEKLRAVVDELGAAAIAPDADVRTVLQAVQSAQPIQPPLASADAAFAACREFVASVRAG